MKNLSTASVNFSGSKSDHPQFITYTPTIFIQILSQRGRSVKPLLFF